MKKIILASFLAMLISVNLFSQDCFKYFPSDEGTSLEYTSYDNKDKPTSTTIRTVLDKRTSGDSVIVDYQVASTPTNADTTITYKYKIACVDDKLLIDMSSYMNSSTYSAYPGMDIEVDGSDLEMPANPTAGQALSGGDLVVKVLNNGMPMLTITSKIYNRKVAAVETITTTAGSFETIKITYDIDVSMGFIKTKGSAAEWYAEDYGIVKSESYDKKGKITSYEVLTKIIH